MKYWLLILAFCINHNLKANDTLYINQGFLLDEQIPYPVTQFNRSSTFDSVNAVVFFPVGKNSLLVINNNTNTTHQLQLGTLTKQVLPNQWQTFNLMATQPETTTLTSTNNGFRFAGLNCLIVFDFAHRKHYFWQIHAYQKSKMIDAQNGLFSKNNFKPDVFTINSKVFPYTVSDPNGHITGHIGDSIFVTIYNSGVMDHSIHFHGFHVTIVKNTFNNQMVGWLKDTFPVKPQNIVQIVFIPHQSGMFPIHDHNLIAVTTGGNYPGGMIGMMHIMP